MSVEKQQGAERPGVVFGRRLRETRRARDLSQAQLAALATEAGAQMNKAAIIGVEKGTRRVTLDEAITLAAVLEAAPANLLTGTPVLALTNEWEVNGGALREWLLTGGSFSPWWPDDPKPENRAAADRTLEMLLVRYAKLLDDAVRTKDSSAIRAAGESIVAAVRRHKEAIDSGE